MASFAALRVPPVSLRCAWWREWEGVGETAFALRLAHRVTERFSHTAESGRNLRGTGVDSMPPLSWWARVWTSWGVQPDQQSQDPGALVRLLRDGLYERRVLLVLDDAAARHRCVRCARSWASAVLVTSRGA